MIIFTSKEKKTPARLLQRTLLSAECLGLDKFPNESNSFLVPTGDSNQRGAAPGPSPHSTQQARPGPRSPSSQVSLGTSPECLDPRKAEGSARSGGERRRRKGEKSARAGRQKGRRVCKLTQRCGERGGGGGTGNERETERKGQPGDRGRRGRGGR